MRNARLAVVAARFVFLCAAAGIASADTFTVTNTDDTGPGSLRQAITDANDTLGSDVIEFAIPGSGVHTIFVSTALPEIIESVLIDGYTQAGSSPNTDQYGDNAVIRIELVGNGTDGLVIPGGNSVVQGLALYGFQSAIVLPLLQGSAIKGNFIGTDAAGNPTFGNDRGIVISSAFGFDRVGGSPFARNLISGNSVGVQVTGPGGKEIYTNLIGTDRTGTAAIPNGTGVLLSGCTSTAVGGGPLDHNVISGNLGDGVSLSDGDSNAVRYNYIGTDATGSVALGNGGDGIRTAGNEKNYLIDHNVVSGNGGNGIFLAEVSFPDMIREAVDSNNIGTAADGFSPIGNAGAGIRVETLDDVGIHDDIVAFNSAGVLVPYPSIYNACEILNAQMFGNRGGNGIVNGGGIGFNIPGDAFNFPIVTSVTADPGGTRVQGYLSGHPTVPVTIELYAAPFCSVVRPRDWVEGRSLLGFVNGATDAAGFFAFDAVFPGDFTFQVVTATSTITQSAPLNGFFGPTKHTSSFSQRLPFSTSPSSGPASGGTAVTVSGTNFDPAAALTICGSPATNVVVNGPTQITAVTPAAQPGACDVLVTNPGAAPSTLYFGWVNDFVDVPPSHPVHDYVVALALNGITGGVGSGSYGVAQSVLRQQMAVFLLKAKHGVCYVPPPCSGVFADVPCQPFTFADWIEALAAEGITGGCGGGNFCPTSPVRRDQMAAFLLKAEHGPGYVPAPCAGAFADVPCPSLFADWIETLAAEGVTAGCGGGNYCPASSNTRGQMAVFLTKTFQLQ